LLAFAHPLNGTEEAKLCKQVSRRIPTNDGRERRSYEYSELTKCETKNKWNKEEFILSGIPTNDGRERRSYEYSEPTKC
jgi:hypothetical protein